MFALLATVWVFVPVEARPKELPLVPYVRALEARPALIGRHGGGSLHIVKASRYYVVLFGGHALGISDQFTSRKVAREWAESHVTDPESSEFRVIVGYRDIEKIVDNTSTEIITAGQRIILSSWGHGKSEERERQLLGLVPHLGLVEQFGTRKRTWARTATAPLQTEELGEPGPKTRVQPSLVRFGLIPLLTYALLIAGNVDLLRSVLLLAAIAAFAGRVMCIGIEVAPQHIRIRRIARTHTILWHDIEKVHVAPRVLYKNVYRPTLFVCEHSGKERAAPFTPLMRKVELGSMLRMIRTHGSPHGLKAPRLSEFGCFHEQRFPTISCGGGSAATDPYGSSSYTGEPDRWFRA